MSNILSSVTLRQFRSYDEASFEFDPGVNIIIGQNAIGKTNLLEAVYVICFGKSFRAISESELIQNGNEWARVDAVFQNSSRILKIEKSVDSQRLKKTFEIGGRKLSRLGFEEIIPVVLFEPDLLRLSSGGPQRRRDFIDALLIKLVPGYKRDLLAYNRVLKQRNALLKLGGNVDPDQMFVWNLQLSERGAKLVTERKKTVEKMNQRISDVYSLVAGSTHHIEITYETKISANNYADGLMKQLTKNVSQDLKKGYTSSGPHRDDMIFSMNGKNMRDSASRGENRTLLLALKIIELEALEENQKEKPLLLLDDVFSELDGSRRKLLTRFLADHQTLITTTDADVVNKDFIIATNLISLMD